MPSLFRQIKGFFDKLAGKEAKPVITPITPVPRGVVQARDQARKQTRPSRGDRQQRPARPERQPRPPQPRPSQSRPPQSRPPQPRPPQPRHPQSRPPQDQRPKPESIPTPRPEPRPWDPSEFVIPPEEGKVRFHDLDLPAEVMRAIYDLGFHYCTPIQAGILRQTLAGRDATGRAQTGTGKTAAFLITILTHFLRTPPVQPRKRGSPRALILAPTRELVLQIEKDAKALSKYLRITAMAVFGGMEYNKQERLLREGHIDIVAATPGRLLDFRRKGIIDLGQVEILVIDEADRMLDMGFIPDVRRIVESTPMKGKRQTMFFSATLTPEVNRLAAAWTRDAAEIDVTSPTEVTLASIDQMVYIVTDDEKFTLFYNLVTRRNLERVMVFANRRDETQFLKDLLTAHGIRCGLLSGDVSQDQRVKTLEAFRNGKFKVLVATDVAARGLHIEGVSHVVNYSLPMNPEDYVHRIGRTGRAGASGISVSFATETEAYEIPEIEKFIGRGLTAVQPEEDLLTPVPALPDGVPPPERRRQHRPRRDGWKGRRPGGRSQRG